MYKNLQDMIDDVRSKGLWLHCGYQNLWFSPDELEKFNREGRFRWGIANWRIRNPQERLEELKEEALDMFEKIAAVKGRMSQ